MLTFTALLFAYLALGVVVSLGLHWFNPIAFPRRLTFELVAAWPLLLILVLMMG